MPNPKSGTVTLDIGKVVKEVKAGKIDFKVDKEGAIHTSIGKSSFAPDKLFDNAVELIQALMKLKPSSAKGTYLKGVAISSTMSPGIKVDTKSIPGI
jgi:large subunit ribosomal protein L1